MSDSEDSTVTYSAVSNSYEDSSDKGAPEVEPPHYPADRGDDGDDEESFDDDDDDVEEDEEDKDEEKEEHLAPA
ncbi:hypothetical protein Tco_0547290, partial [Tanacetum coccineum]